MTDAPQGVITVYVDPADSSTYTYGASTIFEVYIYTTTQNIDVVGFGTECGGAAGFSPALTFVPIDPYAAYPAAVPAPYPTGDPAPYFPVRGLALSLAIDPTALPAPASAITAIAASDPAPIFVVAPTTHARCSVMLLMLRDLDWVISKNHWKFGHAKGLKFGLAEGVPNLGQVVGVKELVVR